MRQIAKNRILRIRNFHVGDIYFIAQFLIN